MKSVIPLIIALVLIAMITLATIYYTTTIVVYHADINLNPSYNSEWVILTEEIRSVLLTTIRRTSVYAYNAFIQTFQKEYGDAGFSEDPSRVITRRYGSRVNNYVYYKYSYFSSTSIYVNTRNPSDLLKLYLKGYNMSRADYLDAIHKASVDASNILQQYSRNSINEWISLRRGMGYRIQLINLTAYYITDLSSNQVNGSIGLNRIGLNVVLDVYSPWSGYKRFNETVEVSIEVLFKKADSGDTSYILPILAKAYVVIGGERVSYIIDLKNVSVVLYGRMFHRMSELIYTPGSLEKIYLNPLTGYYHGYGETLMYYEVKARRNLVAFIFYSMIYNMSLSDPIYDDAFPPPISEDNTRNTVPRHTMTFFIGGLVHGNIDGIYVVAPLQVVYAYLWDTQPQGYNWKFDDQVVGDPELVRWS